MRKWKSSVTYIKPIWFTFLFDAEVIQEKFKKIFINVEMYSMEIGIAVFYVNNDTERTKFIPFTRKIQP